MNAAEYLRAAREAEAAGDFRGALELRSKAASADTLPPPPSAERVSPPGPSEDWGAFIAAVEGRLERGRAEYGDESFTRPMGELESEVEEELLDVCGWAFVLWCRMRRVRARIGGQKGDAR